MHALRYTEHLVLTVIVRVPRGEYLTIRFITKWARSETVLLLPPARLSDYRSIFTFQHLRDESAVENEAGQVGSMFERTNFATSPEEHQRWIPSHGKASGVRPRAATRI